ncbi:tape measure protein [Shewanella glacialimarina]|uniref:tape measure protein n=1 Tax=Shewanella glacialimarina TaxID=2590884 RepID=UPI001CF8DCD2|nr:tape measure protein [Shewanella glacialimarina]UCX05424.1 tape measure protein [Shewanella glacialimarina]
MADKTLELALRIVAEATGKQHIAALVDELKRIGVESDVANPKTQALADELDGVSDASQSGANQVDELNQRLAPLDQQLDQVAQSASTTSKQTEQLTNGLKPLATELNEVGDSSQSTSQKANTLANKLDGLANQQELINTFKRSRNELEQQELALTASALALQDLKQRASQTDAPFVQLARSIDVAEKELEQMQRELAQQSSSHTKLQNALSKSGIDYNNLTVAQRKLGAELDGTGRKVDKFAKDLDKGNNSAREHANSLRGVIGQVTALAGAYLGFDRVTQAVKDIFSTGDKYERLGVQFNALMGSIAGGEQATEWVKDFAKNTPLQLEEVSQVFVKLKAFGLDPMNGSMQAIVDQAFKLGGSFQEVEGISLALGQAWAKQKLQGEEILQLIERGVPVWELLEKATGKNTVELQKLSEQGKLSRDVIKALMDEMAKGAAGAAAANMALLSGLISNAKDNLSAFYAEVSNAGAMDWLKGQLTALNTEFATMAADGRLREWALEISNAIISIGEGVKSTGLFLYEYSDTIAMVAGAWAAFKVGSYFIDMAKGTKEAIEWLVKFEAAQKTAAAAGVVLDGGLKNTAKLLGKLGLAGAAAWSVTEIYNLGEAMWDLIKAENALAESRKFATQTEKAKITQLTALNDATGMLFRSMAEVLQAEKDGLIIYDLKTNTYKAFTAELMIQNAQVLAQEEAARAATKATKDQADATAALGNATQVAIEPIRLTIDEALRLTLTLSEQTKTLENVNGGMAGFIRQIDAAIEPLQAAGDEYAAHVQLLNELKAKFQEQQTYLDASAKGANALEQAYKDLGLTSTKSLQDTAEKSKVAFELIRDNKEPVDQVRDAFIGWAKAAIVAAEASGKMVPEGLKAQAAALQLSDEYQKLTDKSKRYSDALQGGVTSAHQKLAKDIEQTTATLAKNRAALSVSTDANTTNSDAIVDLSRNTQKLKDQTERLNEVKKLEAANFAQLKTQYESNNAELDRLNDAFKNGAINQEEYNRQKERLVQLLNILQQLMGGLGDEEENTDDQVQGTTNSLIEQREELERLEQQTGKVTEYINLFAQAQIYLNEQFSLSDKSTEDLGERVDVLTSKIVQNQRVNTGFWGHLARQYNLGLTREKQIINETLAIRKWTEELESSSATLAKVDQIGRYAKQQIRELGDEELKPLQAAIESTRSRILDLRDDINGTVNSLKDELDQLNNNQTAIEKRRYAQQQAELEAQLIAARTAQDETAIASAKEALSLSREIYQTKLKQMDAEASERRQQAQAQASTTSRDISASNAPTQSAVTPRNSTTTVSTGRVDTVRLELVMPSGNIMKADLLDEFKQLLFRELEQIKATS